MSKYEIGTQWETRGGWRAVVVDIDELEAAIQVWHEIDRNEGPYDHSYDGEVIGTANSDYHLISPWKEKRKGEVWVNVYDSGEDIMYVPDDKKTSDLDGPYIAQVKVSWEEGQFDE